MAAKRGVQIPTGINEVIVKLGAREVRLTNLRKPFWKKLGIAMAVFVPARPGRGSL